MFYSTPSVAFYLMKTFVSKIADFGIAYEEAYYDVLAEDPRTFHWMVPDMIKHKPYRQKVDVYSFELLLWVMVTGTIPYEDITPIQTAFVVINKVFLFIIEDIIFLFL
jgi:serine/threonine protein kinase